MNFYGVIPSRYESSRFPGKPLIDLKGKSMIQRVYEQSKRCKSLSDVLVATDDVRIYDHVLAFGGKAIMTNKEHPSGTDRCNEASEFVNPNDIVINIQGDEPLISPFQIEQLCNLFIEDENVGIASLCIPFSEEQEIKDNNRIKVVLNYKNEALYFSRQVIPFSKDIHPEKYYRHIGIYAYKKSVLSEITSLAVTDLEKRESLEQLRWLYNGYSIKMGVTHISTPNIDVPEDVSTVLALLKNG